MFKIQNSKSTCPLSTSSRGALLLELLIAISVIAAVLSVGSQSVYVSMQSGKTSGETDTAIGLANEALEATRAVVDEKWQNIYDLTKASQYHPSFGSGSSWTLAVSSETIALNTASYTRYVIIQNVCRDTTPASRLITGLTDTDGTTTTCVASTGAFDPSTQKVTVTVSWTGNGSPVVVSDYFLRWKNRVCPQTSWAGGVSSDVKYCPGSGDTTYVSKDSQVTAGTTLYLQ